MSVQANLESTLQNALTPEFLQVENESHQHGGPASDSHFKITAVSSQFSGLPPVQRHRRIYTLLAAELQGGIHALALHLYTPAEWAERDQPAPTSPDCRGGSQGGQEAH